MFKTKSKYQIDLASIYKDDIPKSSLKAKKFLPKNKSILFLAVAFKNFIFFILLSGMLIGFYVVLIYIIPPTKFLINKTIAQTIIKPLNYTLSPQKIKSIARVAGWSEKISENKEIEELKNQFVDFVEIEDKSIINFKDVHRGFEYKLEQGANEIFSYLIVNYAYQGNFNDNSLPYQTTVLVSVPAGSLVLDYEEAEQPDRIDNLSDKVIFEKELILNPGEIKNLKFYYKLSVDFGKTISGGKYIFNLSKKEALKNSPLKLDLNFQNRIKSYSPATFYTFCDGNNLSWQTELLDYKGIELSFK